MLATEQHAGEHREQHAGAGRGEVDHHHSSGPRPAPKTIAAGASSDARSRRFVPLRAEALIPLPRDQQRGDETGDARTVVDLLAEVTARELTTVPTPKRPSGPMARSGFFKILRNPYYIAIVRYKGAKQPGTHAFLIDIDTWQCVQRLLDSRKTASERRRSHDHDLKGTLYCGSCGSRMQLDYPANKQGIRYGYYVCSGRASRRKNCTRRAVPIGLAEQLVADCYQDIAITEVECTAVAAQVEAAFDERLDSRSQELAELTENRQRLQNESDKLPAAHFADAIDLGTLKRHQDPTRTGLADIDRHHTGARKQLSTALSLAVDCATLYARERPKQTTRQPSTHQRHRDQRRRTGDDPTR